MRIINVNEFESALNEMKGALIVGNGLSINFDKAFYSIYNRLYSAHKTLIHDSTYEINSPNVKFKKKLIQNYDNVKRRLRNVSEKNLYKIFEDGVLFAESILLNQNLLDELNNRKKYFTLTFGFSQMDVVQQIYTIGKKSGFSAINIEHWTVLIYFYFVIKELNPHYYKFPTNNAFISIIEDGNINKEMIIKKNNTVYENVINVIFNGFSTYYRMLFSIAIFAEGKSINYNLLENIGSLETSKISFLLNKFSILISLNYDHILENITDKKVEHFHGEFVINEKEYVYNQSLGIKFKNQHISFSDILIGDYFIYKTYLPIVNKLSKSNLNKRIEYFGDRLENIVEKESINTFVIFGMSIENDYHVLRNIILAFEKAKEKNPKLIYCYFNEDEKVEFQNQFKKVITFSNEVNNYAKTIAISFISTKEILTQYFYK